MNQEVLATYNADVVIAARSSLPSRGAAQSVLLEVDAAFCRGGLLDITMGFVCCSCPRFFYV